MTLEEKLKKKIEVLSDQAWARRVLWPDVEDWLSNFDGRFYPVEVERVHALFLLAQVMYFDLELMREMLKSVYENLYRQPIISKIRRAHNDTLDSDFIEAKFDEELSATRFIGVGNPSESGPHLLYYFRQVNSLSKNLFIDTGDIFSFSRDGNDVPVISQADTTVTRYVFIDDLLGSGTQITTYLGKKLPEVKRFPAVECFYYALFATSDGLAHARGRDLFDENAACVFELDDTFKCFSEHSRAFANTPEGLDMATARAIAKGYGLPLFGEDNALGYKDGQLLISFLHNTPDNSLPILWIDFPKYYAWKPIFKRFDKKYN
jgi:hypothetical protein